MEQALQAAVRLLARAQRVVCLTGAGVSAESGVATFRDAQTGLWSKFDPQQLASQEGFAEDPGLVWSWYMARLVTGQNVAPNPGHAALAELEAHFPVWSLFTQNVDDLHERAGSRAVYHLHGSITRFRCNRCAAPYALTEVERAAGRPPVCPQCGGPVRPDVVWFGEMLPRDVVERAWAAVAQCDLMLVVGTSGVVYPAAMLPQMAQRAGAALIDVNPEVTPISRQADVFLEGRSGDVLPRLVAALKAAGK
jgi:NAD-dependent deacetylase